MSTMGRAQAKQQTAERLEHAAALLAYLMAGVVSMQGIDVPNWADAEDAGRLADGLLKLAAAPLYDAKTPEALVEARVMGAALEAAAGLL